MSSKVVASAPGKVILAGEHFVVYGEPSLVVAIDRRAYVETSLKEGGLRLDAPDLNLYWDGEGKLPKPLAPLKLVAEKLLEEAVKNVGLSIKVKSELPPSSGLGSSAAVASAAVLSISAALGLELSKDEVFKLALEAERLVHLNPSGIDPLISTMGGVILYRRDGGYVNVEVKVKPIIIIGYTGSREPTGVMVSRVGRLYEAYPKIVGSLFRSGGILATEAAEALKRGDLRKLGGLMDLNHGLLVALGLSTIKVDKMVYAAREAGALGAKLTGAGGGGCMVALCIDEATGARVVEAIERAEGEPMKLSLDLEGARREGC